MSTCLRNRRSLPLRRTVLGGLLGLVALVALAGPASAATSLTLAPQAASITWGGTTVLAGVAGQAPGVVAPAETVVVEQQVGTAWAQVGQAATTAGTGAWQLTVKPAQNTTYRVRTADSTVASAPAAVLVAPKLVARAGAGKAFFGAPLTVSVTPATYTGTLSAKLVQGTSTQVVKVRLKRGVAKVTLPVEGTGHYAVTVTAPAVPAFTTTTATTGSTTSGRTLKSGSTGPDVAGVLRRLDELGFHTPKHSTHATFASSEVFLAFQKAHGLPRTYTWGNREWAALAKASPQQAMDPSDHTLHIEVSKHRQILQLVAADGVVLGTLAVSTGATGNTPVGTFKVYQKGGSHLPNFMAFHGNFGIHGYSPVPEYPASHGCVREPVWASRWTFNHAKLGTVVHVHP